MRDSCRLGPDGEEGSPGQREGAAWQVWLGGDGGVTACVRHGGPELFWMPHESCRKLTCSRGSLCGAT